MKEDPERGFFCLDYSDDLKIFGNENTSDYQRIEIILMPCNSKKTDIDYFEDEIEG